MNVEKLIEDGKAKFWENRGFATTDEGVEFGVRHTLAAMFPVVKVEELEDERAYYVKTAHGWSDAPMVADVKPGKPPMMWDLDYLSYTSVHPTHEFRSCPTPGELGMGGV